jgi:hypothetical protein
VHNSYEDIAACNIEIAGEGHPIDRGVHWFYCKTKAYLNVSLLILIDRYSVPAMITTKRCLLGNWYILKQ